MSDLARELDALVPAFDHASADWHDAVRRSRRGLNWPVALVAAALVAAGLAATSFGTAIGADALDRLSAWVSGAPGDEAPRDEVEALRRENALSLAPIPADTELGLLARTRFRGVEFELLGFRDRGSLCLRLRAPGTEARIVKVPATCVSKQLLADLGRPLAVVNAADPFPHAAQVGVQALYGLAADRIATVQLVAASGAKRVAVVNNAFLYLYEGDPPRLTDNRLDYRSDVPSQAIGLDAGGRRVGTVPISSLKRGFPWAPPAAELPGPAIIERPVPSTIEWLESGASSRGEPYRGLFGSLMTNPRLFQPNPATSLRVFAGRALRSHREMTCVGAISPLEGEKSYVGCVPLASARTGLVAYGIADRSFDDQHPVHYGLVADDVSSLEVILANGKRRAVPLTDNVFAQQTWKAEPAKLVGYDATGRVVLVHVLAY